MRDLDPGTVFAGCRIEDVAGRGGMGVVYRATDLALGRPVAIKVIGGGRASDPEFRRRFEREARMAASIDHPNVVPLYAAGEADGRAYLVMRYVGGTDLHRELAQRGPLPPARAVAIVTQVAAALDAAHAAGLVHRDVKPANVLLFGEHVYLTDFGLTRLAAADTSVTESGQWVGTVDYASPEQLQGSHCDARSDVYALGCVLFAALTGGPPFPRGTVPATLLAHLHEPPPRVSGVAGVPLPFDRVIARSMAKSPADRYPSTGDLARAATAAVRGEHVTEEERSVARGPAAPPGAVPAAPRTAVTVAVGADPHAATTAAVPDGRGDTAFRWRSAPESPPAEAPTVVERDVFEPTQARPLPPPLRAGRARRPGLRRLAGIVAVVAAAAAITAALAPGSGDPPATGPVDEDEVRAVLDRFSTAFTREDPVALGRTLARDAARVTPADRQDGRAAVTAAYRRQFDDNAVEAYVLDGMSFDGGGVGRAEGTYRVDRTDRPPITGRIVFSVVRERGRPRIALIAATPDA